jgi:hypothetical protein
MVANLLTRGNTLNPAWKATFQHITTASIDMKTNYRSQETCNKHCHSFPEDKGNPRQAARAKQSTWTQKKMCINASAPSHPITAIFNITTIE